MSTHVTVNSNKGYLKFPMSKGQNVFIDRTQEVFGSEKGAIAGFGFLGYMT